MKPVMRIPRPQPQQPQRDPELQRVFKSLADDPAALALAEFEQEMIREWTFVNSGIES